MAKTKCRIGNTCFTHLTFIGGRLFINSPKNITHAHKDKKDFLSVIIKFGNGVYGRETVFMMDLEYITWDYKLIY